MKYNVVIANPADNITIIVLDYVPREKYISISNKILNNTTFRAEQVGFVKKPIMDGELRLEMMGGEFCGNALRSFGMMVARDKLIDKGNVIVEISGSNKSLVVEVDNINKTAKSEMPLPKELEYVKINDYLELPMVKFDGIYHIIAEDLYPTEHNFIYIRNNIIKNYNVDALGVMFFNRDEYYITPVVYVRATDTIFFESSCGSGTTATSFYLSHSYDNGIFKYSIKQPGGIIDSEVYKDNGIVTNLTIGGKVELSEVIEVEI